MWYWEQVKWCEQVQFETSNINGDIVKIWKVNWCVGDAVNIRSDPSRTHNNLCYGTVGIITNDVAIDGVSVVIVHLSAH